MTFIADPQVPLIVAELQLRALEELGWTPPPEDGTKPLNLTDTERAVVEDALGQWAEEYATIEQHAIAHKIRARILDGQ